MAILGRLLKNRRAGERHLAWHEPGLAGPETLHLSSSAFGDGGVIPRENAGKRVGGRNLSPSITWGDLPPDTVQLLIVIEDVDAPTAKPFVHVVALVSPRLARDDGLAAGELAKGTPGGGVTLLRSQMGSGYRGPEPIKGHGPHRYVFQVFALGTALPATVDDYPIARLPPRTLLAAVPGGTVLARGRITGTYER